MNLGVFGNYSYKHVGGSEVVIKNISERLVKDYNYEVETYSFSCKSLFQCNGVKYFPCLKGDRFISQVNKNEHSLIYSDSFWGLKTILESVKNIKCKISLVLVGAYFLQSSPEYLKILKDNIDKFNLVTHSKITTDYRWCVDNNLPVTVIPNGVNLSEFQNNTMNFREKYNIKEKYIITNVSSFFYGKGFDVLPKIAKNLKNKLDDFVILSISSTAENSYDKRFLQQTKQQSEGLPVRFFRNLPREDVVAAFNTSDIFISTSKKEVAPLVLLEARVSKTPWTSMEVGNAKEVPGGVVIHNPNVDNKGYKIVNSDIVYNFAEEIKNILLSKELRKQLISEGQQDIYKLDWNNIVPEYDRIFNL